MKAACNAASHNLTTRGRKQRQRLLAVWTHVKQYEAAKLGKHVRHWEPRAPKTAGKDEAAPAVRAGTVRVIPNTMWERSSGHSRRVDPDYGVVCPSCAVRSIHAVQLCAGPHVVDQSTALAAYISRPRHHQPCRCDRVPFRRALSLMHPCPTSATPKYMPK